MADTANRQAFMSALWNFDISRMSDGKSRKRTAQPDGLAEYGVQGYPYYSIIPGSCKCAENPSGDGHGFCIER